MPDTKPKTQQDEMIERFSVTLIAATKDGEKLRASNSRLADENERLKAEVYDARRDAEETRLRSLAKVISDSQAPQGLKEAELQEELSAVYRDLEERDTQLAAAEKRIEELRKELTTARTKLLDLSRGVV